MSSVVQSVSLLDEELYVRALYPFASEEESSLSFDEGDIIRVLTKLESGWWDGFLDGKRGWFPSNFVEEVELVESEEESRSVSRQPTPAVNTLQASSSSLDDRGTDGSDSPHWTPQTNSDGNIYFRNSVTGAVQYELPFQPSPAFVDVFRKSSRRQSNGQHLVPSDLRDGNSGETSSSGHSRPHDPLGHMGMAARGWTDVSDGEDEGEDYKDIPMIADGDGKILLFSMPDRRDQLERPTTPSMIYSDDTDLHDQNGSRPAPITRGNSDLGRHHADSLATILDWSTRLASTLGNLRQAIASNVNEQYEALCDGIRLIILDMYQGLGLNNAASDGSFATGSVLGNASQLSVWRQEFHQVLNALSKLQMSSRVAANPWATPEGHEKLSADAAELTAVVDAFILHIRQSAESNPKFTRTAPVMLSLLTTGGSWQDNGLSPDSLEQDHRRTQLIQISAELPPIMEEAINNVIVHLRLCRSKLEELPQQSTLTDCALVVKAWQETAAAVRPVLQLCEKVDLSVLAPDARSNLPRSPTIADFLASKQQLYDHSNTVVMQLQDLTRPDVMASSDNFRDAVQVLLLSLSTFDGLMHSTLMHTEFMVQEYLTKYSQEPPRTPTSGVLLESPYRGGKLRQLLGDEVPESPTEQRRLSFTNRSPFANRVDLGTTMATAPPVFKPQPPWFLAHDLEHDLVYDHKGNVKGGTLLALVERLTRHDFLDSTYNSTFLLTYKSFTTADDLSMLLMQRFLITPPEGLLPDQVQMWTEKKKQPVQLRVFNIFKSWMESFFMEPPCQGTVDWLNKLNEFAVTHMANALPGVPVLTKLIDTRIEQGDVQFRKLTLNLSAPVPSPIIPKNMKRLRLLEIDPLELARQLTLMESSLYNKIKPVECLDKAWSRREKGKENGENIKAMIFNSNRITVWVAEVILGQTELKRRVQIIKHLIHVLRRCRELNNFSTLTAIISGLNSAPIHRLRRTWSQIPGRLVQVVEGLNDLISAAKNFSAYRETLHSQLPPCVPFLGVYLTDLTFIEDGNPHLLKHKGRELISFSKRSKTAEVIREIQQYQQVPYALQPLLEVQKYLTSCLDLTREIADMWELSLEREPREREDEKIARLLQESGFL